jgi:hypothetical protein
VDSLDATAASSATRLDALESVAKVFDEWRPGVDGVLDDLRIEVNKLSTLKLEVGKISKYWGAYHGGRSVCNARRVRDRAHARRRQNHQVFIDSRITVGVSTRHQAQLLPDIQICRFR